MKWKLHNFLDHIEKNNVTFWRKWKKFLFEKNEQKNKKLFVDKRSFWLSQFFVFVTIMGSKSSKSATKEKEVKKVSGVIKKKETRERQKSNPWPWPKSNRVYPRSHKRNNLAAASMFVQARLDDLIVEIFIPRQRSARLQRYRHRYRDSLTKIHRSNLKHFFPTFKPIFQS